MTYALGIDVGTTFSAAAVWRGGRAETVPLGNRANAVPSVVLLREDGVLLVGDAAARRAVAEPRRVAREFKRRVGDRVPVMLADQPFGAEALLAAMVAWITERVSEREDAPPGYVTLSCPANWGEYRRGLLRQAAADAGLVNAGLVVEPVAAAIHYASQERVEPGAFIGVYDLGGGTFDATVLRKTVDGFEVHGTPEGDDRLGGVDFDQAVLAHVAASLGDRWSRLDLTDMATLRAVAQVRANAVEAKEALSTDTEAGIAVILPGMTEDVRLTRGEFEGAIRLPLQRTVEVFGQAVVGSGLTPSQLHRVLLIGGSSRIPLVAQLLTAQLGVQVAVDAHPKYAVCLGAAIAAAARITTTTTTDHDTDGDGGAGATDDDRQILQGLVARPTPTPTPAPAPAPPVTGQFAAIIGDDTPTTTPDDTQTLDVDLADHGLTTPLDTSIDDTTERADRDPRPAAGTGGRPPRRGVPPSYVIVAVVALVTGAAVWLLIGRRTEGGSGLAEPFPLPSPSTDRAPLVAPSPSAAPAPDVIAFVSDRSGSPEVWTMNLDGTGPRQVTDGRAQELVHPDWSPDGQRIVFASNAAVGDNADGDMEIWTIAADGADLRQLTDNVGIRDAAPDWSPDGSRIAFSSQRSDDGTADEDLDIWTMRSGDGQDARALTDNEHDDDTPDWSPDGLQIVWETDGGDSHDIYRMNADGSAKVEVVVSAADDWWPVWSPDGDRIAYRGTAQPGGAFDILTATPQGVAVAQPVADTADDHRPNWSPDGRQIVFDKATGAGRDIFVVPADGGTARRLTDDPANDQSPAWRPPTGDT